MNASLVAIQQHCQLAALPVFIRQLHGGDINTVYLIEVGKEKWVVKENYAADFPEMLAKEFRAMQFLAKKSPYYPKVHIHFTAGIKQYLIMEYVEEGNNNPIAQKELGIALAKQHQNTYTHFGWEEDNYIGSLPQINTYTPSWNSFFAEHRLLYQAKLALDNGVFNSQHVQQLERFIQRLSELIPAEVPALLHGDLWGGNYFISKDSQPVLYDPAVYFGHREMDIAMTLLFGGFSTTFYEQYNEVFPLEKGWKDRVDYFQLYPNLVHLNLFGTAYLPSITKVISRF